MEMIFPWTGLCTIVSVDSSSTSYSACGICERILQDDSACNHCNRNAFNPGSWPVRRFYRLLMSVATSEKVISVICFDRAAMSIFGCPAEDFVDFCRVNQDGAEMALRVLEGEPFRMTLTKPTRGSAQHLRVNAIVPLSSGFRPLVELLRTWSSTSKEAIRPPKEMK